MIRQNRDYKMKDLCLFASINEGFLEIWGSNEGFMWNILAYRRVVHHSFDTNKPGMGQVNDIEWRVYVK